MRVISRQTVLVTLAWVATQSHVHGQQQAAYPPIAPQGGATASDWPVNQAAWQAPSGVSRPVVAVHGNKQQQPAQPQTGGMPWKIPSVPFARAGRNPSPQPTAGQLPSATQNIPPNATATATSTQRPVAAPRNIAQPRNPQVANTRSVTPQPPTQTQRPMTAESNRPATNPNPRPGGIQSNLARRNTPAATATAPMLSSAGESAAPEKAATGAPESAAERLMLVAHEAAATSETEAEFSNVVETCRRVRASQPTPQITAYANQLSAWALNRRGQLKADAGLASEALLDFEDAIRFDEKCWRALHNRGVLFAQNGEFEKAFDDFNHTIEINPEFAKAYSNRAALLLVAGEARPALNDYARAIERDPDLAVAHRGRGRACHLLGRLDEASDHYDAAVQLAPDDSYAVASRADLLTDLGRYADAAEEYQRAIELDPRSAYAYRGAAWLRATCPDTSVLDPELAVRLAERAIQLESHEDSLAYDTLAAAQASAGDFASAIETLARAMDVAPENERDVYGDRLIMYKQGEPFRITPIRAITPASYQK